MNRSATAVKHYASTGNVIGTAVWRRKILLAFSQELLSHRALEPLALRACEAAHQMLGTPCAKMLVLGPDGRTFTLYGSTGWRPDPAQPRDVANDVATEAGYTAQARTTVIVADAARETRFTLPTGYRDQDIVTGVSVPMIENDAVVGVISVHDKRRRVWSGEECESLQFVANLTASAMRYYRERQCAETAAEVQAEMLRELHIKSAALDATDDMVVITDINGKVEYVNPAFEQATGFSRHEVTGTRFCFLKSEAAAPDVYHDIWETLFSGKSWKGTVINNRKDGTDYLEEQTITPLIGEDGQVHHFVAIKRVLGSLAQNG